VINPWERIQHAVSARPGRSRQVPRAAGRGQAQEGASIALLPRHAPVWEARPARPARPGRPTQVKSRKLDSCDLGVFRSHCLLPLLLRFILHKHYQIKMKKCNCVSSSLAMRLKLKSPFLPRANPPPCGLRSTLISLWAPSTPTSTSIALPFLSVLCPPHVSSSLCCCSGAYLRTKKIHYHNNLFSFFGSCLVSPRLTSINASYID